ncbi:MAG: efflux RND transporter periplasmic adaptor subunit [Burkholderiales bacterium]|nr:efflux RND transporter periplasmic adaptor subunit [Burkholderiales bacterium]
MRNELPMEPNKKRAAGSITAAGVILEVQAAVLSQEGLAQSAASLANELAKAQRCDRVTVGWLERGAIRVIATSHGAEFDRRHALFEKIGAAMDESIEQATTIVLPPEDASSLSVTLAHSEVHALLGGGVCTVPLVDAGRAVGAITLERAGEVFSRTDVAFSEDVACLLAPLLELKRKSQRAFLRVALDDWRASATRIAGSARAGTRLASLAVVAVAAAMFVPVSYHVSAPARLEGFIQRIVAAPIDGFLEQVNVRPGDKVHADEIIAELSQRDLQTERAKRQSELTQEENLYGAALARSDRTQLVIHHAKAAEAQAQLTLVNNHIQRAQIRAPFDGVVIKGDLSQSLGAPVQRGEVLMTLAPDERFRVIVEVDERDVGQLRTGLPGRLAIAATPGETHGFRVSRILPMAVAGEGRNYFEVEGVFDTPGNMLRPGMRGVAKVATGERSVLWIATHRAIEWLRLVTWSLGV